jgi:beta-lactamase superfamily II metal-dependent hydrolase
VVIGSIVLLSFAAVAQSTGGLNEPMRVHFIDVGQGAATLVEFPCAAVLIDAGGERWPEDPWRAPDYDSTAQLLAYLEAFFAARPDLHHRLALLILTHPHLDHTRGVPDVLARFSPGSVVYNGQRHGSGIDGQNAARAYARTHRGVTSWYVLAETIDHATGLSNAAIDPVACPSIDPNIRVLWGQVRDATGWASEDFSDENNHSVVVRIDYGAASILFTGDLEAADYPGHRAGIEHLLDAYRGSGLLDADVYHVGHHGARNGTTLALLDAISPQIAVISAGPPCDRNGHSAWTFAHPRTATVRRLERTVRDTRPSTTVRVFDRFGSPPTARTLRKAIYSTGWDGTIVLEARPDGTWTTRSTSGPPPCLIRR